MQTMVIRCNVHEDLSSGILRVTNIKVLSVLSTTRHGEGRSLHLAGCSRRSNAHTQATFRLDLLHAGR